MLPEDRSELSPDTMPSAPAVPPEMHAIPEGINTPSPETATSPAIPEPPRSQDATKPSEAYLSSQETVPHLVRMGEETPTQHDMTPVSQAAVPDTALHAPQDAVLQNNIDAHKITSSHPDGTITMMAKAQTDYADNPEGFRAFALWLGKKVGFRK